MAAKLRIEDAQDRDMTLAWHVAALTRGTKGMPKLERLLKRKKGSAPQPAAEQAAIWQVAAAVFGGTFRPLDPKTVIIRGK